MGSPLGLPIWEQSISLHSIVAVHPVDVKICENA